MSKRLPYIRGRSADVRASDGNTLTGVTGFVHARDETRSGPLCGTRVFEPELLDEMPERETERCHVCLRIERGDDPVFDSLQQQGSYREFRGTRARPRQAGMRTVKE